MDQPRGNAGQSGTPWWYRIPPYPLGAIVYCVTAIVLYRWFSQSVVVCLVVGAVTATAVGFVQGLAQGAYNQSHRRAN